MSRQGERETPSPFPGRDPLASRCSGGARLPFPAAIAGTMVTINQGNVEGLMRTSSQLHFPAIQKVCSRYLRQQMDATNCLGICEFGESHGCPEVSSKAWSFLQENFEAVSLQEEFLQLSKERLAVYLSNDQLQVQEERSLVEAVLRWVRHEPGSRAQFLPELLELTHLVLLPDQYLQNLLATEPLVRDSDASKALVARSRSMGQSGTGALKNPPAPPQKLEEVLVVVGGRVLEDGEDEERGLEMPAATRNFAFYNPKSRRWMALPDFPDYNKWGFSLVALNNDVYVTGGSRGSQNDTWSTTQAWCFCPREGAWQPIASMLRARTNHTSAVLNGEIYVIGGTTVDVVEVERYDPYNKSWCAISPALKYVSNFAAASCLGKLYLVGSCAVKYNALTLQCYNPVQDLWSVITSPFIPKYLSAPRCATLRGLIYLIGDNTKKVHVYNPEANIWQKVQLLHTLHENGGMVALGDRLFVTGGHWKGMDGDYRVEMEPEREEMFQRGPGLNLTSGQYTAPLAGFYTFSSTLHIARREPRRKRQGCRGSRLRVLICVQSRCQHNRYHRAGTGTGPGRSPASLGKEGLLLPSLPSLFCSHLESVSQLESSGELFTISVTGTLYLQAMPGAQGRCPGPANPSLPPGWAACLCFCGQHGRLSPHRSKWLRFQCCAAGSVKRLDHAELVPGAARPFPLPATIVPPLLSTKPKEEHLLMQGAAVWSDTAHAEDGQKIMKVMMMMMMIVIKQPEQDLKAFTFT
ncbi:hypothetical protein EK904_008139 [Melospiza melodia maxima]|nr:hypothetical protein EK904_008139 [Melospiza melodia maxima]